MPTKYRTKYKVATGSITESFIVVERWTIPVYPTNDGELWFYDPETGEVIILEDQA